MNTQRLKIFLYSIYYNIFPHSDSIIIQNVDKYIHIIQYLDLVGRKNRKFIPEKRVTRIFENK